MWGIIPAAGLGSRIQPLACSKELLPVAGIMRGGHERPRAVSELLVDRMRIAGITKLCFIIAPTKADIVHYYGSTIDGIDVVYLVQPKPAGLCDALFRASPFIGLDEPVVIGLPDTVWFPEDGFRALGDELLSFLLFPVDTPEMFDAVVTDAAGFVQEIQVKRPDSTSNWIWGAFKMPGRVLHELHQLWIERDRRDEYLGTLVNAYLAAGGRAIGVRGGESYVDVGTLHGYRHAIALLGSRDDQPAAAPPTAPALRVRSTAARCSSAAYRSRGSRNARRRVRR